uniref:Fe2OG dioxygenase domain-containing protein n=1 Tax=Globisporangium ultimum (strain ATCC 200006 / CBS 805.95 / DAOM BR144) TaxID=431595 RepID=K3X2W0_GLOUD
MTTKRKAERILEKKKQHPVDEHELDLFLNTAEVSAEQLAATDALASASPVTSLAAPDSVGKPSFKSPASPCATDSTSIVDDKENALEPNAIAVETSPSSSTIEFLPGMVLLKNFLSPSEQQQLVDDAQRLGLSEGGFYKPTYASGAKCRLHQMCLGRHWNVVTEQYEQVRTNFDNAPVLPLPAVWSELAVKSLDAAKALDPRVMGECKGMKPDICVVNYYKKAGRNGMHIDKDESEEAMAMGSPVISFSIGSAAEFAFIDHYPEGQEAVPVVRLETGDVLVFGGPSRKVVHALTRVYPNTQPEWLRMRPGRLNFTFREYKPTE